MLRRLLGLLLCLGLAWLGGAPPTAAAAQPVAAVTVDLADDQGQPLPPRLAARIQASAHAIAEQVLIGRPVAALEEQRTAYERMVREVFDRILIGYSVAEVCLRPGETTVISLRLAPWGEVVEQTELLWDETALPAAGRPEVNRRLGQLKARVDEVLLGMPVDAADWGGSLARTVVRDWFFDQLPEFRPDVEVSVGRRTQVKLVLTPQAPLVQSLQVTLRSRSLPNMLLFQVQQDLEKEAQSWRYLPVAFAARHQEELAAQLLAKAHRHPWVRRLGLQLRLAEVRPGPLTEVVLEAESDCYRIFAEGYLDMGKEKEATTVRLHAGWKTAPGSEVFVEVDFLPNDVKNYWYSGLGFRVTPRTEAGLKYNAREEETILWLQQQLGGPWGLRLERHGGGHRNEAGVRYKVHDFLSAEYVFTNDDQWLRLIGTF